MADVTGRYELPGMFLFDDQLGGMPVVSKSRNAQLVGKSEADQIVEAFRTMLNSAEATIDMKDRIVDAVSSLAGFGPMLSALQDVGLE